MDPSLLVPYYNNTRIQAKLNGHSPVEYR
ncbi:hypothetical protein EFL57_10860 [Weissella confusa]|nr:hypothetical protein [Weissella confusa]